MPGKKPFDGDRKTTRRALLKGSGLGATAVVLGSRSASAQEEEPLYAKIRETQDVDTLFLARSIQTTEPERGPFVWTVGDVVFNGRRDPITYLGYNQNAYGGLQRPGENGLAWAIEADYDDGVRRNMETYIQYVSADGATSRRPLFFQFDRATDQLTGASILGNPLNISHPDPPPTGTPMVEFYRNLILLKPSNPSSDGVIRIQAAPNRSAYLMLGFNGVDNTARIGSDANSLKFEVGSKLVARFYATAQGAPGATFAVGADDTSAAGLFSVAQSGPHIKALVARGRVDQTASIFEAQDSAGAVLSRFNKSGYFMTRKNQAPADADLANGELALWFDPSAVKPALMIKAKDSLGLVKTASIALR